MVVGFWPWWQRATTCSLTPVANCSRPNREHLTRKIGNQFDNSATILEPQGIVPKWLTWAVKLHLLFQTPLRVAWTHWQIQAADTVALIEISPLFESLLFVSGKSVHQVIMVFLQSLLYISLLAVFFEAYSY